MAIIAHLDMDAFFAAVEERNNPQWAGMPIVVGSDPRGGQGRGVVSTANYAARKFGIHSATPIRTAWKLAKAAEARGEAETIFLPGHWHTYSDISKKVMSVIKKFSPTIQQTGADEAYFDVSFAETFPAAEKLCQEIKDRIKKEERLTASVGIGPNKLIAKIAANHEKPDGLTSIAPENVETFLEPMPVRAIPGVGPKTEAALHKHGIKTIRDLKRYTANELDELLGKRSPAPSSALVLGARGVGSTSLADYGPPKSISEQQTFWKDTHDPMLLTNTLHQTAENLMKYLNRDYSHISKYR
ncbi:MAG: DNA polymerase IV, partial [Patescibacteria group bacterium]